MKRICLQKIRKDKNLTQEEVAKLLGITTVFYGMLERGERNPSLDLAKSIADLFGTTIEKIFFDNELYKMYMKENDTKTA